MMRRAMVGTINLFFTATVEVILLGFNSTCTVQYCVFTESYDRERGFEMKLI